MPAAARPDLEQTQQRFRAAFMSRTGRHVLVTGAAGFLGRACLAPLLAAGYRVTGTYLGARPARFPEGVEWRRADLRDPPGVAALLQSLRASHLLALAWPMGPDCRTSPENYRWISHSIGLLFTFAHSGGTRAVLCGTCAEYDWMTGGKLHETQSPLCPACDYGAAKAALFAAHGPMAARLGVSAAWARPFFLYGPGENRARLAASVITSLLEGREARCTDGMVRRDYMHTADAGRALAMLLDSDAEGPVNIGSGRAIPLAEIVGEIGRQTGREHLLRLGAMPSRPGEAPLVEADTGRLTREVGFSPHFNLETGLADTIGWWRAEMEKTNS